MESSALHEIDDLKEYLHELEINKNEYIICAAVKDTLYGIDEQAISTLRRFGMKNIPDGWNGYVFLMELGVVYIDKKSKSNIPLIEHVHLNSGDWQIVSKAWRSGNKVRIIVEELDFAVNGRGLNVVVIDSKTREVVDSVCFDFFPGNGYSCVHKFEFVPIPIPRIKSEDVDKYDINKELNNIIIKYQLYELYPRYSDVIASKKIIKNLTNTWKDTDSIACIVMGESNEKMYLDEVHFLEVMSAYKKNQIDFYRCLSKDNNNLFVNFYNWEAYDFSVLESVVWDGYSHIYIISNQGENFAGVWLRKHNIKFESLCDILCENGCKSIPAGMEHYEFVPDKRESRFFYKNSQTTPMQWEYYEQSIKYITCDSKILKDICAKKCFFISLMLKDFLHAEKWLKRISEENDSHERYCEAWQSVQSLLKDISIRLQMRKQKDILAVWVDHTLYEDIDMMPFVSSLKEKSIWFENIFTLTGYTRETLRGLFTGKKLIDDMTGKISSINLSNSPVLRSLEQNGYRIQILLSGFRTMFPWKYRAKESVYLFVQTSELFWDSISLLLESCCPGFILLPIEETHPPYVSLEMNAKNAFSEALRAKTAYEATDGQIQFYTNMLGENATAVIFSDHGGYGNGNLGKFWPRQQVFLSVYGKRYRPKKIKNLCSSIDFYKIMDSIARGDDIREEELSHDFVEIQGVPIVSNRMQIEGNGILPQAAPAFWPPFRGYKGIVTDEYIYIFFAGGHEWLSRRDKIQPRLSWYVRPDDICNPKLLPEMREKAGIDFGHEPSDYGPSSPFYLATQEAYEKNYAYNEKKLKMFNFLITILPEYSVALYLGNMASHEMYLALSLENRKKIVGIIDAEDICACSDLNVSIFKLEEAAGRGVRNIIVSSRTLPGELNSFLDKQAQGMKALGIYGWFEVNGYHTKHNFYDFAIQSMDAPLPSPLAIPDFLYHVAPECPCEVSVVVMVEDESTLLSRLHDILRQTSMGVRIHCLDLTGKAAELVKAYQKVASSIEVISVAEYSSLPSKLNELISSVNSKYLFFLDADESLHVWGLFYLHEIAEQTEADVVAAGAIPKADKNVEPILADFAEGTFELKKEARILPATFKERYGELDEIEIPDFAGNKLYRVDFLRKHGIRFQDIKSGWKDIFCLQTIFGAPKYVKVVSPVCISSGNASGLALKDNSAEYAKELVGSMFAYQQAIEAMLKQWRGFGNNPSLCDKFRERAMTIFDQQYFSGIALDDEMRKVVSQAVQEELQENPSIGMWWIKYLFMRSSFHQSV